MLFRVTVYHVNMLGKSTQSIGNSEFIVQVIMPADSKETEKEWKERVRQEIMAWLAKNWGNGTYDSRSPWKSMCSPCSGRHRFVVEEGCKPVRFYAKPS